MRTGTTVVACGGTALWTTASSNEMRADAYVEAANGHWTQSVLVAVVRRSPKPVDAVARGVPSFAWLAGWPSHDQKPSSGKLPIGPCVSKQNESTRLSASPSTSAPADAIEADPIRPEQTAIAAIAAIRRRVTRTAP